MGTVASLLAEHVSFRLSCVDRLFVQGYIAGMQSEGMVVRFLQHRGYHIPSPTGFRTIHDRLVKEIASFVESAKIPQVKFKKGQSKEDYARPFLQRAEAEDREGVVLVGVAQERVQGWRGFRTGGSDTHPHFSYRRQALWVNHYYFYLWDRQWGPAFIKLCPYAPYPVWAWVNGHEWLKRRLTDEDVPFEALDNGIRSCADPTRAQQLADSLSAPMLRGFLARWLARLPNPLTDDDHDAGFAYEFSFRQTELSDTAVFDRPGAGRAWFEAAIRDHLDLGRPERVSLVVDRRINRRTPGRFETRVITRGIDPYLQIFYKSSKVKAYFKESRALRVETTINNPRDFDIRKTVNTENWEALRRTGVEVNARFLAAVGEGAAPPADVDELTSIVLPSEHDGLRAPGLRFGDPRVMALLAALACFTHVIAGLTNAGLRELMNGLLEPAYTSRHATYDLRRLRRKGLIERVPGKHLYRVTPHGRAVATLFTKLHARVVVPALPQLDLRIPPPGPRDRPIVAAWQHYNNELEQLIAAADIAA